ncbi:MAG: hypothetical protein R6U17_00675 [Thermoplasmata archaeon]
MSHTVTARGQITINMSSKQLICPKCEGKNIVPEAGFITGYKYHCRDCGYIGALVFQED